MELIRRSVWVYWTTATSLTSSPGPQNGSSSCFEREGLNSWANLYSSDRFENGAPALKWRERGLLTMHLPTGETNANHLLSYRRAIQHLAEKEPVNDAGVCYCRQDDNHTIFLLLLSNNRAWGPERGKPRVNSNHNLSYQNWEAIVRLFPFSFSLKVLVFPCTLTKT